jgi:hypothetical protein
MPVISALGKLKHIKFEANLGYTVSQEKFFKERKIRSNDMLPMRNPF